MSAAVYLDRPLMASTLADSLPAAAEQLSEAPPLPLPCESPDTGERNGYFLPLRNNTKTTLMAKLGQLVEVYHAAEGNLSDCLLILASTTQNIQDIECRVSETGHFNESHVDRLDHITQQLKQHWGFREALAINTSCTSAANALLYGARLLRRGEYRRVLVLAYETPSDLVMQGFGTLGLNSLSGSYRPFHTERDGLVLGEAYAATLLSLERSAQSGAVLLGGASGCDTSSMTATRDDGSHIHAMATRALQEAAVQPAQIQLLKYHGTGTASNDIAEAAASKTIFTDRSPLACCLKPWLGHTLGACGLTEVLLLMYCIRHGLVLPMLAYAEEAIISLPSQPVVLSPSATVMANFSGFGGNNASLILQGLSS